MFLFFGSKCSGGDIIFLYAETRITVFVQTVVVLTMDFFCVCVFSALKKWVVFLSLWGTKDPVGSIIPKMFVIWESLSFSEGLCFIITSY